VTTESHFKGWAKPGPVPPGLAADVTAEAHETLDAISGHFRLFQLRDGHRFSTDDILTAWSGTSWCPTARTALDLGSGIGTVGMICAWRLPGVRFVTVEAQSESVALAKNAATIAAGQRQPCERSSPGTETSIDVCTMIHDHSGNVHRGRNSAGGVSPPPSAIRHLPA